MEPFDGAWRAEREALQEQSLPAGRVTLSCSAPFGGGGLGRHLHEIWGALGRADVVPRLLCGRSTGGRSVAAPPARTEVRSSRVSALGDRAFAASPAWSTWKSAVDYDRAARRHLGDGEHLLAFNGQALAQMRAARSTGYQSLGLVSATAHMRQVAERQRQAYERHPLERPWGPRVLARNLAEYELADTIYVSSEHVRESFVAEGVSDERLRLFPLTPDPRYDAAAQDGGAAASGTFEVLYVGSLSVAKGVPLLVESVRALEAPDLRLVLLGGWASRGMRRFLSAASGADPRIVVKLGDPLEHLRSASLYVHPSYADGFGYAPCEALAAGLPVIVTEDTGMKELIAPGRGLALPTGDGDALAEAIEAAYRREILTL
jgi:glycosyltransferase involved in cell wall biosynthesis